jgi:glycosyltransferase involved in cell wall biosynthesis
VFFFMTITHVIPYMHPHAGGPPVVVDRLCQRLIGRGWDVRVITTDSWADGQDDVWEKRYRDHYPLEVHKTGRLRGYAYSATLAAALKTAIQESSLVHLHTLWSYPTLAAARICRKLGIPYVVMPHGMLDPHSLRRKWLKKWLYGHMLEWPNVRAAQAMIYTHAEEKRLAEQAVSSLPPGHIVPLGADDPPPLGREALAEQFLQEHPELRGRSLVTFLGRLHPKKGLDLLIPAFADVLRSEPNARLLLVGPGEESYLQSLRGLIAVHGLTDKVHCTGPLTSEAKWQALSASAVFALPSYQENFALTVVEALRCGVPVVLSRRVNIWEEVTQAGAALACDLSVPSVASAILQYLKDPAMRATSAARGQQLAADHFNWERSFEALEMVYRRLLPKAIAVR